jgi:hypothetical protein
VKLNDTGCNSEDAIHSASEPGGWIAFNAWLDQLDVSRATGWRWRKRGWIRPTNISGKNYLTAADVREFNARAARGEFAIDRTPHGTKAKQA